MSNFKERLLVETNELEEKLDKLDQFICCEDQFDQLDKEMQSLLSIQSSAMDTYLQVLKLRLSKLNDL